MDLSPLMAGAMLIDMGVLQGVEDVVAPQRGKPVTFGIGINQQVARGGYHLALGARSLLALSTA